MDYFAVVYGRWRDRARLLAGPVLLDGNGLNILVFAGTREDCTVSGSSDGLRVYHDTTAIPTTDSRHTEVLQCCQSGEL
jgi:hypothetical protein